MNVLDLNEVRAYIRNQPPESKIYLGADSERVKMNGVWYADYTVAVVIHIGGNSGGKVFGEVTRERDYDQKKNKPAMRLMNEVIKVATVFQDLAEVLEDREVEVHLDINPDLKFGSSCVIHQAIGYIRGTCNLTPVVKPDAWAATSCADRLKFLLQKEEKRLTSIE
jgi:hypothetical protein